MRQKAKNLKNSPFALYMLLALELGIFFVFTPTGKYTAHWSHDRVDLSGFWVLSGEWWRLITYAFVHRDIIHLATNCIFIWYFGRKVEKILGHVAFLFLCITAAIVPDIIIYKWTIGSSIGSSAIMFGLFGAYLGFLLTQLIPWQNKWNEYIPFAFFGIIFFPLAFIPTLSHVISCIYGLAMARIFVLLHVKRLKGRSLILCAINTLLIALAIAPIFFFPNPTKLWEQAHDALDKGHYDEAIRDYTIIIDRIPSYGFAYQYRAWCYYEWGDRDSARRDYVKATMKDPKNPYAFSALGQFMLEMGNDNEALRCFQRAAEFGLDKAGQYENNGLYFLEVARYQDAIKCFSESYIYDSSSVPAMSGRGFAHFYLMNYPQAENDWRQAACLAETQYEEANCLFPINYIYLHKKEWRKAIELVNQIRNNHFGPKRKAFDELILLIAYDQIGERYVGGKQNKYIFSRYDVRLLKRNLPKEFWPYFSNKISKQVPNAPVQPN